MSVASRPCAFFKNIHCCSQIFFWKFKYLIMTSNISCHCHSYLHGHPLDISIFNYDQSYMFTPDDNLSGKHDNYVIFVVAI